MMTNKQWLTSKSRCIKGNTVSLRCKTEYLLCTTYDSKVCILD